MNKVKWLVEKNAFNDSGVERLMKEIENQGMECLEVKYIPGDLSSYLKLAEHNECVVSYTGIELAKRIRNGCQWSPGNYCFLPNFKCSRYYAHYFKYLLNYRYLMMPISQLVESIDMVKDLLGSHIDRFFIRPDRGDKPFAGTVLKDNEITLENLEYGFSYKDTDLLVLISEAMPIEKEWRFFVSKDKVLTGSQYMINCELEVEPGYEQGAWDFAQKILDEVEWKPEPIFVMDICKMMDTYFLLELNSASTSGLYDCEVKPIVETTSEYAIKEWSEIYGK